MKSTRKFRKLTTPEIKILSSGGCSCDDWTKVHVIEGFDPSRCQNVTFSGDIRLGNFSKSFTDESGVKVRCGINNAHIHNCDIGSDVLISNIGDYIANYRIEDDVIIKNCGKIHTEGVSTFGNGTQVAVLNETGGRSVRMWEKLSAHQAYIIALYRHRYKAISNIERMVAGYSESVSSDTGSIGTGSHILSCRNVRNVRIGAYSKIEGAISLDEGSINSCKEDPVLIGPGVIMEHFIVCSGSIVTESTLIDKCFIGQG
ncbi:MAG: DUF4954 family protein, partial [Bacteroidia bacterium]